MSEKSSKERTPLEELRYWEKMALDGTVARDIAKIAVAEIERLRAALEQLAYFRNQRTSRRDWVDPDVQLRAIALAALSGDPCATLTEESTSVALGTKVTLIHPILGCPLDGWKVENIDEPRERRYRLRHSSGALIDVYPDSFVVKAPAQCTDCLSAADDTGKIQHKPGCSINYL